MFKTGDYIVHKTGGPVFIIEDKSVLVKDGWKVRRWDGSMFRTEHFAENNMRTATTEEIATVNTGK